MDLHRINTYDLKTAGQSMIGEVIILNRTLSDKFQKDGPILMQTLDTSNPSAGAFGLLCDVSNYGNPNFKAFISQNRYLGSFETSFSITYLFDETDPVDESWTAFGKSIAVKPVSIRIKKKESEVKFDRFVGKLLAAETLELRLFDFDSEHQDNKFDVSGARQAMKDFMLQCFANDPEAIESLSDFQ